MALVQIQSQNSGKTLMLLSLREYEFICGVLQEMGDEYRLSLNVYDIQGKCKYRNVNVTRITEGTI